MRNARPAPQQPSGMPFAKYRPFLDIVSIDLPDRTWPDNRITTAPRWLSTDLRDGNQSLIEPMGPQAKRAIFDLLVNMGFKEIEIGFPAASQTDFDFVRSLVDDGAIPEDVTISVLTQSRGELIDRTLDACIGIPRATVHLYNALSPLFRNVVFRMDRDQIRELAVDGTRQIMARAEKVLDEDTIFGFEYSPEIFVDTELEYSLEVCRAVMDAWEPEGDREIILNLPATVERATPNIYADQIEWMSRHLPRRESVCLSLHTHNDRGCAVAASELAVMAGADRVEGTLLGNGERTGNMDIMIMAMNLYSQGIDPGLDFSRMNDIVHIVSECNNLPVHPRHPYIGELVFTAFSGSHQDAIKKSLEKDSGGIWDIAYLPIDPLDIGRSYQDVVRINSQSGKGGVAYILARDYGLNVPRWLQIDFAQKVQAESERTQKELTSQDIIALFEARYLHDSPLHLDDYTLRRQGQHDHLEATLHDPHGNPIHIGGNGSGAMSAFINALQTHTGLAISVANYAEHAMSKSTDAQAVAYVQLMIDDHLHTGIAYSQDTVSAMLRATLVAIGQAGSEKAA